MLLEFTKMNGAGNDFVLLDNRQPSFRLSREQVVRICDRHRGVGIEECGNPERGNAYFMRSNVFCRICQSLRPFTFSI